jgi:hypothetical protein
VAAISLIFSPLMLLPEVRRYSLPTQADRQRAIDSLLTDG